MTGRENPSGMRGMSLDFKTSLRRLTVRDSGRKIIDILSRNPNKDPEGYEEDDIAHMRKVVSYCKVCYMLEPRLRSRP